MVRAIVVTRKLPDPVEKALFELREPLLREVASKASGGAVATSTCKRHLLASLRAGSDEMELLYHEGEDPVPREQLLE